MRKVCDSLIYTIKSVKIVKNRSRYYDKEDEKLFVILKDRDMMKVGYEIAKQSRAKRLRVVVKRLILKR